MDETPQFIGRYHIERQIGTGAMGRVFKALDPEIGRHVAIKIVRNELLRGKDATHYRARFRQEVQAASRCVHPNVVSIFDFGSEEGSPYFVMEYVDGSSLEDLIPDGLGLGPPMAGTIILQVLAALEQAHASGVIHRDIKPANVFVTSAQQVKVMDFGISRITNMNLTAAGAIMGTPHYMAPEQHRGETVDARSDIFSTGVLLYETLVGRPPLGRASLSEVMAKVLFSKEIELPPVGPGLPLLFRETVRRAIELSPDDRFQTAKEMADSLARALVISSQDVAAQTVMWAPAAPSPQPAPNRSDSSMNRMTPTSASNAGVHGRTTSPDAPPKNAITARDIERAQRDLAFHLGPIAKVLVDRALKSSATKAELRLKLAEHLHSEAEKTLFLSGQ